jgi:hypothetical protein
MLLTCSKITTDSLQSPNVEAIVESEMMDLLKELAKQRSQSQQKAANHTKKKNCKNWKIV